jgi:hypothetical protein
VQGKSHFIAKIELVPSGTRKIQPSGGSACYREHGDGRKPPVLYITSSRVTLSHRQLGDIEGFSEREQLDLVFDLDTINNYSTEDAEEGAACREG